MCPTPDDMRVIENKLFEYELRNITKVVMAPTKDFYKVWAEFLKGMENLGVKKYEDYKLKQIKEMIEF
jgi:putative aldouronate transport system substrate-binding protein